MAGEWPELRRRRGQAEAEARPARARGCGGLVGVALAPTASTRCGERVDAMPGTKWSPEHHRRRVQAAAQSGERREAATACQRGNGEGEDDQKLT